MAAPILTATPLRQNATLGVRAISWMAIFMACGLLASCKPQDNPPVPAPIIPASQLLRILAWNVELNGADVDVIAKQLNELNYSIYALTEVAPSKSDALRASLADSYKSTLGTTGRNIRIMVFVDSDRCELLKSWELKGPYSSRHRSPLVCRLKDKVDGKVFLLVTNHLARGNAEIRQAQAVGLREWARDQTLPVVCVGDFNFDYNFADDNGNEAFREFMRDGVWKWVKPVEWIDTNWADRNRDGADDYPRFHAGLRVRSDPCGMCVARQLGPGRPQTLPAGDGRAFRESKPRTGTGARSQKRSHRCPRSQKRSRQTMPIFAKFSAKRKKACHL